MKNICLYAKNQVMSTMKCRKIYRSDGVTKVLMNVAAPF